MRGDFIEKKLYTTIAKNRRQFVAGRHERRRPVREVCLKIFVGPAVVADVGVSIDKTRRNIEPAGIQDFRRLATRVSSAWADVTDSPIKYRDFHTVEDFAGIDVDEFPAAHDKIGFHLSHCPLDQVPQLALRSHHVPFLTHMVLLTKVVET